MRVQVDHFVIHVSDQERANDFYARVLGAELESHPDGRWAYRFGAQQVNVHGSRAAAGPGSIRPRVQAAAGSGHVCFVWPGPIETAVDHLRGNDVAIEEGPVSKAGGRGAGVSVYFRDPDGNLLELISYQASGELATEV